MIRALLRTLYIIVLTRQVVEYYAVDHEHGLVVVEVRANRLTGRLTRRLYESVELEV